jgi:myo-inositol-1(or 4)-monophosphatase
MTPDISQFSFVAIQAALRAGEELKRGFQTSYSITTKPGKHNLVTDYDTLAEEIILSMIHKEYPDHSVLAEESGEELKSSTVTWIVDPLDGTVNFAHNIPVFSVSIAAAIENEVVCGVVYQPITGELFVAEKNKGSFLNGQPLKVSSVSSLDDSFLATGFPYNLNENPLGCIEHLLSVLRKGLPVRRLGSAALDLSYLAAGRYDGYWEVSLQPWDMAAGKLIVEEAGGKITDYKGQALNVKRPSAVVATNGKLHHSILGMLKVEK